MEKSQLSVLQNALVLILYISIAACIILSLIAVKNVGEPGYDKCMEEQCKIGKANCEKFRTISNCCQGAGGQVALSGSTPICTFE